MCCQFEKVNRTKNRWKIAMKEGVFHVHGEWNDVRRTCVPPRQAVPVHADLSTCLASELASHLSQPCDSCSLKRQLSKPISSKG
jgi:hypothetical protein